MANWAYIARVRTHWNIILLQIFNLVQAGLLEFINAHRAKRRVINPIKPLASRSCASYYLFKKMKQNDSNCRVRKEFEQSLQPAGLARREKNPFRARETNTRDNCSGTFCTTRTRMARNRQEVANPHKRRFKKTTSAWAKKTEVNAWLGDGS